MLSSIAELSRSRVSARRGVPQGRVDVRPGLRRRRRTRTGGDAAGARNARVRRAREDRQTGNDDVCVSSPRSRRLSLVPLRLARSSSSTGNNRDTSSCSAPPSSRRRIELQELRGHVVAHLHDRRLVSAPIAVVGGAEDGHQPLVVVPEVPLHHELVRPRDHLQPVGVVELFGDVLPERVSGAARRHPPHPSVIRVAPHQVAHRPLVRHLLKAIDLAHILQRIDQGAPDRRAGRKSGSRSPP